MAAATILDFQKWCISAATKVNDGHFSVHIKFRVDILNVSEDVAFKQHSKWRLPHLTGCSNMRHASSEIMW